MVPSLSVDGRTRVFFSASGKLVIQASPELHRRVALEAARRHVSVNTYVQEVLEKAVTTESHL